MKLLPNLIVIGARKCATTSLHYYLSLHPDIYMSEGHKELNYFVKEQNWSNGLAWYQKQFPVPTKVRGEASPNYARFPMLKGVPKRMHVVIPETKLIYMVRDPLEQIASAYYHDFKAGAESRPFEEVMDSEQDRNGYLRDVRYYFQIEQFLPFYPKERILVVNTQDLKEQPYETMAKIFRFVDVDPGFQTEEFKVMKNVLAESASRKKLTKLERFAMAFEIPAPRVSSWLRSMVPFYSGMKKKKPLTPRQNTAAPPVISGSLKEELRDAVRADVMKLREWTGQSFAGWCI